MCPTYPATVKRLLALVSAIIFVDAMLYTALTPLVPAYAEEFDLSKTGAGLLVAAFGAGALLGGVPGGLAAARFGPKHAVVWGLVLLGLKENVIIGKLIPAATGLKQYRQISIEPTEPLPVTFARPEAEAELLAALEEIGEGEGFDLDALGLALDEEIALEAEEGAEAPAEAPAEEE